MYAMLGLQQAFHQDITRHELKLGGDDDQRIPVQFYDTKGAHFSSSLNQLYREMHGFIVMCDVTNL